MMSEQYEFQIGGARVQSLVTDEGVVWLKKVAAPKATLWHRLQSFLSRLIPVPTLRVTVSPGGQAAIEQEAGRLRVFQDKGFHVPRVLAVRPGYLVLSDAGVELKKHLDGMKGLEARWPLLVQAAEVLASLHAAGIVHGRPYLRDMVYESQSGKIGFVDLEEDPLQVMPMENACARDIWIFLCSSARFLEDSPEKLDELYGIYRRKAGDRHVRPLHRLVRFMRPFRRVVQAFLFDRVGKDVKQAVLANGRLENIFR